MLLLVVFLFLRGREECLKIWISYHEVESIKPGALELDWTWRLIAVEVAPFFSDLLKAFEHGTVELDESFGDDWLVFAFSPLDAHHGRKRTTSSNPFGRIRASEVLNARHVA